MPGTVAQAWVQAIVLSPTVGHILVQPISAQGGTHHYEILLHLHRLHRSGHDHRGHRCRSCDVENRRSEEMAQQQEISKREDCGRRQSQENEDGLGG